MAEEAQRKWGGKATAELSGPTADQVWPLLADFCTLDRWLPFIDTCEHVGGPRGQVGQIRRCSVAGDGEKEARWGDEKLVEMDPTGRWLSYEIVGNNMGFKAYAATMRVIPTKKEEEEEEGKEVGCAIEWSFACDPIEGWRYEDLLGHIEMGVKAMAKKMEEALSKGEN